MLQAEPGPAAPCRAVTQASIILPSQDHTFYEADLAIACAPPDPKWEYVVDPVLIVEVLSSSTAPHDGGDTKLPDHRQIPSVREILRGSCGGRAARGGPTPRRLGPDNLW